MTGAMGPAVKKHAAQGADKPIKQPQPFEKQGSRLISAAKHSGWVLALLSIFAAWKLAPREGRKAADLYMF